jgi:hypothetical protein
MKIKIYKRRRPGMVVHIYNPNYKGGTGKRSEV